MKPIRVLLPASWLIAGIAAVAAFGYHYAPALPIFWVAMACAIFITAELVWRMRMTPPARAWHPFNLNDCVRVRLTPKGREIYMRDFKLLGGRAGPLKEDADGWRELQCWQLMQIFGPHISRGSEPLFSTQIEVQL